MAAAVSAIRVTVVEPMTTGTPFLTTNPPTTDSSEANRNTLALGLALGISGGLILLVALYYW